MVALFRFREDVEIVVELFLLGPGRAVDAGQHRLGRIATPIGAGHLHQLEDLQPARGGHVRAAAEIDEIPFAIQADGLVGRDRCDDFRLVVLAYALEVSHGVVAQPFLARDGLVFLRQLGHLFLDGFQVLGGEGPRVREIVIKAVFDDRADGDLRIRKQRLDRIGQQVGGGMADQVQAVRVLGRDDVQAGVLFQHIAGVHELRFSPVHGDAPRQCGAPQACAYRMGYIGDGDGAGKLALRAIGQGDLNHKKDVLKMQKRGTSRVQGMLFC